MQQTHTDDGLKKMEYMTQELLLSVRDLQTHFPLDEGNVVALDGVDLDIKRGKTLAVVGESGCGKSVTARSILRILDRPGQIVGGNILFNPGDGEVIDIVSLEDDSKEMREIRGGEIGLIFQEPMTSFSPVHTIGRQLSEAVRLHNDDLSKDQVKELCVQSLDRVGIPFPEERINSYAFELSGGLRQRAMIALALMCNPSIVIADEPTTALDVTTQAQILRLLRDLQSENGMAIMLITHNLGVVAEMADEVAVMYLGKVIESGPVDEIFHDPRHPYTQALLKSIPSVTSEVGDRLESISGVVPHPYDRPTGCSFYPRCDRFMEGKCEVEFPQITKISEQHDVSCFLYE